MADLGEWCAELHYSAKLGDTCTSGGVKFEFDGLAWRALTPADNLYQAQKKFNDRLAAQAENLRVQMETLITDPVTGGQKGQKPEQMSLLPVEALLEVSKVYGMGAEKYSRDNWRLGYDWHLSYDALQRHLMLFWGGQDTDDESGLPHLAHAAFHILTLLTYSKKGLGNDDRPR